MESSAGLRYRVYSGKEDTIFVDHWEIEDPSD
jgi:hypothetical protein